MMYRLPAVAGEWIDRARTVRFVFEGEPVEGHAGDTISSALAAQGRMTLARSFKYHRRRGLYSAADHDANNLFQIGSFANQRGDRLLVRAGWQVHAVNTFGGLARDRGRFMGLLARLLPVGFYYKTFIGGRAFPLFERVIRHMSGLGRVDLAARPAPVTRQQLFCDVAIVGAGVTGLQAALEAAHRGARRVVLIDENSQPGGSALWAGPDGAGPTSSSTELLRKIAANPAISVLTQHCAWGLYADNLLALSRVDRQQAELTLLRARAIVLATGVIEQPCVFRGNDLPGVLLASAARRLLHRQAVAVGRSVVILGANDDAVAAALDLTTHGVKVTHLAWLAGMNEDIQVDGKQRLQAAGIVLLPNAEPVEAHADASGSVAGLTLRVAGVAQRLDCDALLMSCGWAPALQLALQAGSTVVYDPQLQQHLPSRLAPGLFVAGRANGHYANADKLLDATYAGAAAATFALGESAIPVAAPVRKRRAHSHPFPLYPHPQGKEFVDLDEDLTLADLKNAAQEGFDSIELLKRYSTVGMGPSQGKLSNLNAARQLAALRGDTLDAIGLTTARPPYQPVSLGSLAGRGFSPARRLALDAQHAALGAAWMPLGHWRRPEYYRVEGRSREQCIAEEVAAVRGAGGVIDVSTLGKIEVMGIDAAELLERLYTGRYADMLPGTTRYALMVDEAGTLVDDGVIARLGQLHYYVTATSSGAAAVYREMQRRVAEWGLDCILHNVTGHMAALNVAGPDSRQLLQDLCSIDLSEVNLPFLAIRECAIAGVPARLMRVGFVGELGYEIHVACDRIAQVWRQLSTPIASGALRPFGVEAQRLLRLEKAHVIVGQDSDGLTTPYEAGLGWAVKLDKPFFVGQRSLRILKNKGPRQRLVGFAIAAPATSLAECHLVIDGAQIGGRITSIGYSQVLRKVIGLAMVTPALAAAGGSLSLRDSSGALHTADRVATPFYDPDLQRQKAQEIGHAA